MCFCDISSTIISVWHHISGCLGDDKMAVPCSPLLYDTLYVLEIYNYQALLTLSTVKISKINQELKEIN